MTQEEKQLVLQDLCGRLPYGIYANLPNHHLVSHKYYIYEINIKNEWTTGILYCAGRKQVYGAEIKDVQPYLRPMSSMTEEEEEQWLWLTNDSGWGMTERMIKECVDFLNKNMLDYRGLIPKGLANEAPEGMYKMNKI